MKDIVVVGCMAFVSMVSLQPRAEAIPAFSRQTGAACLSCHFQTFPALTPLGRAFKMGSFTDVGAEALVEDDKLSIPAVLNASMAVRANARHVSGAGAASVTTYHIPTDTSFIIAGRVGANTGAFVEFSGGKNSENGTATSNIQLLNSFDIGNVKFGVGWASTSFGGSGVMEVSNVFGQHANKLGGGNLSAINAAGFASNSGNAIGGGLFNTSAVAAWIGNDLGCIQFALLAPADATGGNTAIGVRSGYLVRGVAMLDIAGWDALAGFGSVSGNAGTGTAGSLRVPMRLLFFDAQVQGYLGNMSVGVYADGSRARGQTGRTGLGNFYGSDFVPKQVVGTPGKFVFAPFSNVSGTKFSAASIRIDLNPLPRLLVGAGFRWEDFSGLLAGQITRRIFQMAITWRVYQNLNINVVFDHARIEDPSNTLGPGASVNPATGVLTPGLPGFTTRTAVIDIEVLM